MSVVVLMIGIGLFALVPFGLLLFALVDLLKQSSEAWEESGQSQLLWALVVIFVWLIGPVLYLLVARPALAAASARGAVDDARS
ncbi:MAG: hypothetical protein HKO63_11970 [Acidimicrobiia bacterium]|nr:PLDc N-terminal domain-containing protein [Acidimicrobiia bacterium]MBT8192326.1 PLDc N-terminal domain-containing protein [Acidimicrobiia bacterium]MBT8247289.1 PLDc N-terminal domain-containing protein [Acidimicrobiia bacterium]NNF87914.1 hypothetical protein [Acidimicrobiia bacterium]NNJ47338.1 hypothetical protein [Acidimicrobiia bacterium]